MCQNVLNLYEVRNQGKMLPKFANKNIGIYIHDTCKADLGWTPPPQKKLKGN